MKKSRIILFTVMLLSMLLCLQSCQFGIDATQSPSPGSSSEEQPIAPSESPSDIPAGSSSAPNPESSYEAPTESSSVPASGSSDLLPPDPPGKETYPPESTDGEVYIPTFDEIEALAKQTYSEDTVLNEILGVYDDAVFISLTVPQYAHTNPFCDYQVYGCYHIKMLTDGTGVFVCAKGMIERADVAGDYGYVTNAAIREVAMLWYERHKPYKAPALFPEDPFAYSDTEQWTMYYQSVADQIYIGQPREEVMELLDRESYEYKYYGEPRYSYVWDLPGIGTLEVEFRSKTHIVTSVTLKLLSDK